MSGKAEMRAGAAVNGKEIVDACLTRTERQPVAGKSRSIKLAFEQVECTALRRCNRRAANQFLQGDVRAGVLSSRVLSVPQQIVDRGL